MRSCRFYFCKNINNDCGMRPCVLAVLYEKLFSCETVFAMNTVSAAAAPLSRCHKSTNFFLKKKTNNKHTGHTGENTNFVNSDCFFRTHIRIQVLLWTVVWSLYGLAWNRDVVVGLKQSFCGAPRIHFIVQSQRHWMKMSPIQLFAGAPDVPFECFIFPDPSVTNPSTPEGWTSWLAWDGDWTSTVCATVVSSAAALHEIEPECA